MEGGQKASINLEAGLNINTSDMLTPLTSQTFQHNWQKFQGKFLPNSLRFEKNGWAAGWNVYNFEYNLHREEHHGMWLSVAQYNNYTKAINLYENEDSYEPVHKVYVISENNVLVGSVQISDNTITGNVKGTPYQLTWNPVEHTIVSDTEGMSVSYSINNDYSTTVTVTDTTKSFSYTFDLYIPSGLSGDSVDNIAYIGYSNGVHTWGQYSYIPAINKLNTPEGVSVNPTVSDNQIEFSYEVAISDETEDIQYSMANWFVRFSDLTCADQTYGTKMLIGSVPSEQLAFDRYSADVSPNVLMARDSNGVVINYKVPLWAVASLSVTRSDLSAKKCDNVSNYEVSVAQGTGIRQGGVYHNVWDGAGIFTIDNEYRSDKPKYVNGLVHRFNEILLNNTIEPSSEWQPIACTINNEVWFAESRRYKNIRGKRTSVMTSYLGDVYTWGNFSFNPATLFTTNNPWDWSDSTNAVYTDRDISEVLSVRLKTESNNYNTGDDEQYINDNINPGVDWIATLTGTTAQYSSSDQSKAYSELYDSNGVYIGETYEDTIVSEEPFWPFEKVPKFNFIDDNEVEHIGVYWTDGISVVTDIDVFMNMVLGNYDSTVDPMNSCVTQRDDFNRIRVVKHYTAGFDFEYIKRSDYSDDASYISAKQAWNTVWNKYYPNDSSPQDMFDGSDTSIDTTYMDFYDIQLISNADPQIKYVTPGVYIFGDRAVPFNADSGLILYKEENDFSLSANIWHQYVDKSSEYTINTQHETGYMRYSGNSMNLPYYFGKSNSQVLVQGVKANQFRENRVSASIVSSKLTLGINYNYEVVIHQSGSGWYGTWEWTAGSIGNSCWLGNILISYEKGTVSVRGATLPNTVESIGTYQCVGDINSGIKFAWPVWGNSATRLVYTDIKSVINISDQDAFIVEPVPTISLANRSKIYFDRNDTDKSLRLFDVIQKSIQPDAGDGTGNLCVSLTSSDNGFLYYAKKQYDENQNEKIMSYYIPGIAYGDPSSSSGNMEVITDYPVLKVSWKATSYEFPISVIAKFSNKNILASQHKFYTAEYTQLSGSDFELGSINMSTLNMPIVLKLPVGNLSMIYNGGTKQTTVQAFEWINSSLEEVTSNQYTGTGIIINIPLSISLYYKHNSAKFIKLSDYTLVSSDDNNCVISDGTNKITYDIQQQIVTNPSTNVNTNVIVNNDVQHVNTTVNVTDSLTLYLKSVYDGTVDGNQVTFNYNNNEFIVDLNKMKGSTISVKSTDIREPSKTKTIGKIETNGQYQLLKQQWNSTVEVENFWWIDSKHVLELNQYAFVLKRNTDKLSDWDGNIFESIYEIGRGEILPTNIRKYFVTNVYMSEYPAMLCTLQEDAGSIKIKVLNPRRKMEEVCTQYIKVKQHNLGEELNDVNIESDTAIFNSYNPIEVCQVLSKAIWSSTIVKHWLIIGCHMSNNYDQWSFVVNLDNGETTKVIQGYGYVGLHGELTGGQMPADYFDENKGFNSKVDPVSTLVKDSETNYNDLDAAYEVGSVDKVNNITPKVVGTSEQQWYIQQKLYGIVSHLTFNSDTGAFTKEVIPITNNYSAKYSSPSFYSSVMGDICIQMSPLADICSFDGAANFAWQSFLALIGYPLIYSIAPRYAQLVYLQQSFGQYAYVHYNTSKNLLDKEIKNSQTDSGINEQKNKQTDPVLSSAYTFDRQKFSQKASVTLTYFSSIIAVLIAAFGENLQILDKKQSVNEEQNQTATSDFGRKYLDNVLANTGDMLASAIVSQARNDSGVTSVVTGLKSLDMFYSTSDRQQVYAGPGFVEHQFVADCISQSVTDTQVEGKTQQLYMCLRTLTILQIKTVTKLLQIAADGLDKAADATAAQMVCGTSLGAVGVAMHAAADVMRIAANAQEIAVVELDKMMDILCSKGVSVSLDEVVSRHALSVEGKHKYGEKNEVFMWPCFGVQSGQLKYTDEWVECGIRNTPWALSLKSVKYFQSGTVNVFNPILSWGKPTYSSNKMSDKSSAINNCGDLRPWTANSGKSDYGIAGDTYRAYYMDGNVPFHQIAPIGKSEERSLPDGMACIEGVSRFLPNEPFKNENISVSEPAFTSSMQQDYIIDNTWDLSQYCTYGLQQWVAVKDTKVIDCPPSNMIVNADFCGIACPYTTVEVKRGIEKAYMRPWAITPNVLAFNCTGYNSILQNKLYHAFDGISYRIINAIGSPGMNKNMRTFFYSFQINDRFKRSNVIPANELQGNFESEPIQAIDSIDKLYTLMTIAYKEKGLEAGTVGEDKDLIRWSVPIFTELVNTLPASVKTMTAMTLGVVEGVTSLCVDLANNQSAYKAPLSVDFTIGKNVYRATEEYICSVQTQDGIDIITDLIPILGLKFIGSTPTEAYFYSKSTRCYYTFTGSSLTKMDMMERFRDIQNGYWDFVNQEVVLPCLMTFKRLNKEVEDKDTETDNIIIPVLSKNQVSGELPPPNTTIFNDRSWYKCVSLPCGFAYQGPNRVIINRGVFCEYMERSIKNNYNKWKKIDKEKYVTHREYNEKYTDVMKEVQGIDGWTYNPFILVTSAFGVSEDTDCIFEWNITFCWPVEMDLLYGTDNYAVVNIVAETMTPGGKVVTRPTHIYLTKELFTHSGNYGYYSFRYQSKNGMGNRERLHIWSDQYIAISSIDCEYKIETMRRNEQLTQQVDIVKLKEL